MGRGERGAVGPGGGAPMPKIGTEAGRRGIGEGALSPYRAVTHAIEDVATSAIDKIPGGKKIRQAFMDEAVPIDLPAERGQSGPLFQSTAKAKGEVSVATRHAEKLARSLDKDLRGVADADRAEVYRYMAGRRPDLPATAARAKGAVDSLLKMTDDVRREQLDRKIMSQDVFDEYPRFQSRVLLHKALNERMAGRIGNPYRVDPLVYRQDAPGLVVDIPRAQVEAIARRHGAYLVDGTKAPLLKFRDAAGRDAFAAEPSVKGKILDKFDPLSETTLAELGELVDPAETAVVTIARAKARVATHDMLASWEPMGKGAKGGDWVMDRPAKGRPMPDGYTLVENKRLGPLNGKVVRNDLAEFGEAVTDPNVPTGFVRMLDSWQRTWKETHTGQNPGTHGRNWISLPVMSVQAGVNILNPVNWGHWTKAIKTAAERGPAWDAMLKKGVVKQDFLTAEGRTRIKEALNRGEGAPETIGRILALDPLLLEDAGRAAMGRKGRGSIRNKLGDIYSAPDDLIRLAAYEKLKATGRPDSWALGELDATTYNYSRSGKVTRGLSRIPIVSPFARFAHETLRINYNNLRDHPVRLAETIAFGYLAKKVVEATFGSDVSEAEKQAIGQKFGSQAMAVGRDEKGRPKVYDPRYVHQLGQALAGPRDDLGGDAFNWLKYVATVMGGGESPALRLVDELSTGKDEHGRATLTALDKATPAGTAKGLARIYGDVVAHPLATRGAARIEAASEGRQLSPRVPVQNLSDAILSTLTGFSTGSFDQALAIRALKQALERTEAEIKTDMKSRVREDPEDRPDVVKRAADALKAVRGEATEKARVLHAAGVPR